MSRLKIFYDSLITQRPNKVSQWLKEYRAFIQDVALIREELKKGCTLQDSVTYTGTSFEVDGFDGFMRLLLFEKSNGIASRGQSVLSDNDYNKLISDEGFIAAVAGLVQEPDSEQRFIELKAVWKNLAKGDRPLLRNRVLAACTTSVSTTVDERKFNQVWGWLIEEDLIEKPTQDLSDWRARNHYLMKEFAKAFSAEIKNDKADVYRLSIFVWQLYENLSNPFTLKLQEIRYGAPGTGKTYQAKKDAQLRFEIWQAQYDPDKKRVASEHIRTVQFHPSYCYEDFMEGFRPELKEGSSELCLRNGIFKELCMQAGQWELDLLVNGLENIVSKWKSSVIKDLLPHRKLLQGELWDYIFKQNDDTKLLDAVPPWFLIIDEINRAELSRVLGELMFCLEYRGMEGAVQTQYGLSNDEHTGMWKTDAGYRFFIPHNIYVIGTMNTIDRSVESFDFALRRRFRWREVTSDPAVLSDHLEEIGQQHWQELVNNLEKLNCLISAEQLLGEEYVIGHAYLMNLPYPKALKPSEVRQNIWEDSIKPLLIEYLRGSGREKEIIVTLAKAFGIT